VTVVNNAFTPANLSVTSGSTVTWTWNTCSGGDGYGTVSPASVTTSCSMETERPPGPSPRDPFSGSSRRQLRTPTIVPFTAQRCPGRSSYSRDARQAVCPGGHRRECHPPCGGTCVPASGGPRTRLTAGAGSARRSQQ
jgi:hypothetical protein